ncbi:MULTISPECIES: carbohydrate ABC transporter permease [unclassified Cryobacterium]|uniref:carbohydrate ABC transporter permease n=1 Tax=unclassified Cryobacterium TaxID=2649013 RepID=UPI002AC942BA|nr:MULTISPECIES: carbohydrate ABC transporter permease [Cryobacterium]MEB0001668.1 carbohydrate ABC transporter permease [Cryobacterium sp. RTC2.1]MEB0286699.1 carbohydrate ABC transporter permease [Cryobacterium sp. 10S3]MEB0303877.1 carbohydrate ABC transporter permease [Cryobacterium sp. 10I1]MEC5148733.1 multiple sugar transport system permease protein [Cryobacterium psychrotolerans]WPX13180.1 carbohydrate ABC transporter permease [Cryobacterium sp. 10S3]
MTKATSPVQHEQAACNPRPAKRKSRSHANRLTIIVGIVLGLGALATAFPFIWMLTSSLKPRSESVAYPPRILPQKPTFEFFVQLFQDLDFGRYLLNTIGLVLISMIGLLLMAMAGYGFAKFTFRGRDALFFLVLVTMMIPVQVTMIPTYLILNGMKLTNTIVGIALPTLVSGFSVFLFRQFMTTIPSEMMEAARIDGAGEFRVFLQIVLPLSKPILAVQVILTFIASWNSFLWPLIIANDEHLYTLSVGIALLNQQIATNPSLQMAAATLMVVPILIIFVVFQRYVVQGFSLSGLK